MFSISDLPTVNVTLNATSAFLVATGFVLIRQRRVQAHKVCMLSATAVSALFLISYVVYHKFHGFTRYPGVGWVRVLYFSILIPHTILAMVQVPLVLITLFQALRGRFDKHRRIARWTLPIWFFVSMTGVVIYFMVYRLR